jgi:NADH:ubiquinone oxidoreductase subunit E
MAQHQLEPKKRRHPGGGRRRTSLKPKGRQVSSNALQRVSELLDGRSLQRDHLIEYLHLIQDAEQQLSADHLAALSHLMRLSLAEVYETATFYAHFDISTDQNVSPSRVTVRVCDSLTCELMGAQSLLAGLEGGVDADVKVVRAPCMGRCDSAPVAEVGHHHIDHASVDTVTAAIAADQTHPDVQDYLTLKSYQAEGGYGLIQACVSGEKSVDDVITLLSDSGLSGFGGAGFPTG